MELITKIALVLCVVSCVLGVYSFIFSSFVFKECKKLRDHALTYLEASWDYYSSRS